MGVHLLGIAATCRHRIAHGSEVDKDRNAREVLEEDP